MSINKNYKQIQLQKKNNKKKQFIMDTNKKRINRWYFGGVSSAVAVCITHPLDLIKVHLQTQQLPKQTIVQTVREIHKAGGIQFAYLYSIQTDSK